MFKDIILLEVMPPVIEVSDETLNQGEYIYIPTAKLRFAKQKIFFGKNWNETHELLSQERLAMPTPLEFSQTLKYLRDNPNQKNTALYDEIIQVRNPWRATLLDAYFEKRKDGLYVLIRNKTKTEKLDENTLMKDRRISLDSWLDNPTSQGLPKKDVAEGDL